MTDTTNAPEKIWAARGRVTGGSMWWDNDVSGATEYIRADIHQAETERLQAEVSRLRDALFGIEVWLSDTLSGRTKPDSETYKDWLLEGIREARGRACKALASSFTNTASEFERMQHEINISRGLLLGWVDAHKSGRFEPTQIWYEATVNFLEGQVLATAPVESKNND